MVKLRELQNKTRRHDCGAVSWREERGGGEGGKELRADGVGGSHRTASCTWRTLSKNEFNKNVPHHTTYKKVLREFLN